MPSIRAIASLQSARVPAVTRTRIGIPFASTARCIFVLSPLLYVPCPGSPRPLPPRGDAPCNGTHLSSAIHNRVQPPELPGFSPIRRCPANGETAGIQSSISHIGAAGLAKVRRLAKSKIRHSESACCPWRSRPIVRAARANAAPALPTLRHSCHAYSARFPSEAPHPFDASIIAYFSRQHNLENFAPHIVQCSWSSSGDTG